MGGLILLALIIIAFCTPSAKKREERRKAEAAQIRAEVKRQQEQAKALLRKQREMEREQARQRAEQERQRKEQERLAKEQERQAKELAKHEERITKMEFALEKAKYDIDFLQERVLSLEEMLKAEDAIRSKLTPGSKQEQAAVKRIMTLQNQLHTANVKLGKARFEKERAEKFLQEDVA